MKGILKKCILYVASFALLSTALSTVFLGRNANAASAWDAVVVNLETLVIRDQFGGSGTRDITNTWLAMATDGTGTTYNALSSGQRTDLTNAYLSGRYWVGIQDSPTAANTVYIFWDNTSTGVINPCGGSPYSACPGSGWFGFSQSGTPSSNFAAIQLYGSNVEVYNNGQSFASAYHLNGSSVIDSTVQTFENSYPVNYPSGYAGDPIGIIPDPPQQLRPSIIMDVNDKDLHFRSGYDGNVASVDPNYKIQWFITNASFDGPGSSCDPPWSTSGYSTPELYLDTTVPCYGDYGVTARYVASDGSELPETEGFDFRDTIINININGDVFSINTSKDFTCNLETDVCTSPTYEWVDEECDLLHLGGCVNNVLHYLKVALGIDKTRSNPTGSPFVSFQTETFGLTAIITAPLVALNTLTTATCTPITLPIPFVNQSATLPCYYAIYQANFGAMFVLYQTVVFGVVSYFVIVGVLREVKQFKDPKKDQIEVLQL